MNIIKSAFWNSEQNRIRTGYRIIIFILISILATKGIQFFVRSFSPEVEFSSSAPLWFFIAFAGIRLSSEFVSVWITGRFFDRRKFSEFGFQFNKNWWTDLAFGMGLGIFLMTIIFTLEYAFGWIAISNFFVMHDTENIFLLSASVFIILFISVGISEELMSRGYLLTNLAEGFHLKIIGPKGAVLISWFISSAVFGLAHMDNPNATFLSTFNIIIGGLFFGFAFVVTRSLAFPIGIHITWNFFQANVYGFPVSGFSIPSEVVTFIKIEQSGPEFITGGSFGPEAGLLGLLTILLGFLLTYTWYRYRNKTLSFQPTLASYKNISPKNYY